MKKTISILFILLSLPLSIFASAPNNKFGISLAQPNTDQFTQVKELINSNNGDWGYVTLIIQENDRDKNKWQDIFNLMRQDHLIPIIRLATQPEGENWRRPEIKDVKEWVDFLDSLNWVVKNRYVVLFNEPNHGSEWGGEVDEKSYAEIAAEFAKRLKEKNKDFFIMLAGFDASAPSWPPGMEDEEVFLRRLSSYEDSLQYIDGWASHSYPNPGFSGSPFTSGRGTVRTYEWELGLLRNLGVTKELPVFITETGWKRGGEQIVAENFQIAFDQIWGPDTRVVAVTPFVFDYQGEPFLEFSWKKFNSQEYYIQYSTVQAMLKIKGEPEQIEKGWINFKFPTDLVVQSTYNFKIKLENLGQAVWDKNNNYKLIIKSEKSENPEYIFEDLKDINPFEEKEVYFTLKTNENLAQKKIKFILQKNDKNILESDDWNISILPLPSLKFKTGFFPFGKGRGDDYEIQIFNVDDRLVFKKKKLTVKQGLGELKDIQNIALDELYRVVLLKPYHLPRQEFFVFKKDNNEIKFKSLLPFDLNNDGALNFKDILRLLGR
ncbi:MAG: hypothetical protein WC741_02725 [Patescibacteria group bacterium]|jgi:hypothetical protein